MPSYDSILFDPPAPLAHVTLRNPKSGIEWANVQMLIDTGADITLLPQGVLEHLGNEILLGRNYELAGFDGSASLFQIVQVDLIFLGRTFHGQYTLINEELGILGRNVLNVVPLFFDGPRLTWGEYRRG